MVPILDLILMKLIKYISYTTISSHNDGVDYLFILFVIYFYCHYAHCVKFNLFFNTFILSANSKILMLSLHHCFIWDQFQCFIAIYIFQFDTEKHMLHTLLSSFCLFHFCGLFFIVLTLLGSNSDFCVMSQLPKWKLPSQNQNSCTLSAYCDCWFHLCYTPLLLGPMHHQTYHCAWQDTKKWSQLNTCQHHLSPNKLPMLSPQPLHYISPPTNEEVTSEDRVKWEVWTNWDDNNQQGMNTLDHFFWWQWQQQLSNK